MRPRVLTLENENDRLYNAYTECNLNLSATTESNERLNFQISEKDRRIRECEDKLELKQHWQQQANMTPRPSEFARARPPGRRPRTQNP